MLGLPARYFLSHPLKAIATIASDPLEMWTIVEQNYRAQHERAVPADLYRAEADWDRRMHERLGVPWPCEAASEFAALWPQVMAELEDKGVRPGPETLHGWNDGDAGLARAIWCLTRHLLPNSVLETGVLHGVTSRFVLEALARNGTGRLWSIDLPPFEPVWQREIGIAVDDRLRSRWSYIKGTSKRRLPEIIVRLGQIDIFIHDSLHSEQNVRFEIDRAFAALRPRGAIVVDDIDANWGFRTFTEAFSGHQAMICEAEPIRPDLRRFNQRGLFGIILKEPASAH